MKKTVYLLASLMFLAGCSGGQKTDLRAVMDEFGRKAEAIMQDSTMTQEQQIEQYAALMKETYMEHRADSAGLMIFIPFITNFATPEEALAMYEESDTLIRNNPAVRTKVSAFRNAISVAPGKPYKDVTGVDALTGEALSLSSFIGGDKPVLVDFWASWCGPCRREIKSNLLSLAASGRVSIVGIAVWEDSVDDTEKAMSELGITWPVIFSGGRENSPSIDYGVVGIPTLFLISPDGTILATGHSVEEFSDKLQ